MTVIGLTGPSGSGKSIISQRASELGIPVTDCDALYHSILTPNSACTNAVLSVFGDTVRDGNGGINRRALSKIVFADAVQLQRLNHTVHPFVTTRIREEIQRARLSGAKAILLDAPTLFEAKANTLCDRVLGVLASPTLRISRIRTRDGLTEEAALRRIKSQPDDAFYIEHCDAVLYNNGNVDELTAQLDAVFTKWEVGSI